MANWFYRFIPEHISNKTVLRVLELMRRTQKLRNRIVSLLSGRSGDRRLQPPAEFNIRGFMESQHVYSDVPFGCSDIAYSGCEIIAVYNVLLDAAKSVTGSAERGVQSGIPSFPELVREFEKDGMLLGGKFGTAPYALRDHLQNRGFKVTCSFRSSEFDGIAAGSDSLILTMYNNAHDISEQIHTVAITKDTVGYTAHNVYCNGRVVGPYLTFRDMMWHINEGRSRGICLIGIQIPSKEKPKTNRNNE